MTAFVREPMRKSASALCGLAGAEARGVVAVSPYAGQLYRAELGVMPLHEPREYLNTAAFEHDTATPVLICPSQRYAILSRLVREARAAIEGLSTILVRLCGPDYQIQLPAELLAPDVLLTHDPELMLAPLVRSGRTGGILCVWHSLRTDGFEPGDNALALTVFGAECVPSFLNFARADLLLSTLQGLRVTQWDAFDPHHGGQPVRVE